MAPMQAHAGMGTTKKRRNCARGAAKAKKDARAYIAPDTMPGVRRNEVNGGGGACVG